MGFELAKDYTSLRKAVFDNICTYLKNKQSTENWPFLKEQIKDKIKNKARAGQVLFVIEIVLELNKILETSTSNTEKTEPNKYIPILTGAIVHICNEIQTSYDISYSSTVGGKNNSDLFDVLCKSITMEPEFRKQLTDRQFEELYSSLSSFLIKRTYKTIDGKIHPDNGFLIPPVFAVENYKVPQALVVLTENITKHRVASLNNSIKLWKDGPMTGHHPNGYNPGLFSQQQSVNGTMGATVVNNHSPSSAGANNNNS